jgi:hypothetical protein
MLYLPLSDKEKHSNRVVVVGGVSRERGVQMKRMTMMEKDG